MADQVKNKTEKIEAAFKRLFEQPAVAKTPVADRKWTAMSHASLITYLVEAHGGKFPSKEAREAFRKDMTDSDLSFSSNGKKYSIARGWLPKEEKVEQAQYE